jgi:hypothetical protein
MSPSDSIPRRIAAVASVTTGLALIGASAGGVIALDSQLQAATTHTVPARLAEDQAPYQRDGRCRRQHFIEQRSPEV